MKNTISFKSKFGWISASEKNNEILSVSFAKSKNRGKSILLNKLKKNLNNYFSKETKKINPNILLEGSNLQMKIWKLKIF